MAQRDDSSLERLAYVLSSRALAAQESGLNELRARTGILLAASSLVASFLGPRAVPKHDLRALTVLAFVAFVVSIAACLWVLMPKTGFIFALRGSVLLEEEAADPGGLAETYRRLAYWLEEYHDDNQPILERLFIAYQAATVAVLAEVMMWSLQLAFA